MNYHMYLPTRTLFGAGELNNLNIQEMPGRKAMIVISNGNSARANGALGRTEEQLHLAGVETAVFDRVQANPLKDTVMEGAAFARENGCDFVVALGGGSVMDAAKIMAMMAPNPGDLWDFVAGATGKTNRLKTGRCPSFALPLRLGPARRWTRGAWSPTRTPTKRSAAAGWIACSPCLQSSIRS